MPPGIDCSLVLLCIGLSLNDTANMFEAEDIRKTLQRNAGEKEVLELIDMVKINGIEDDVVMDMCLVGMR